MPTYKVANGSVVVQVEDLLGRNPTGGWVYQAPGVGNAGAQGAHYYYRSQTQQGSHKTAPKEGRFTFDLDVAEAGTYSILLRASRDTANPGDARNDIWIKVDGGTQSVIPGKQQLTSGGDGFVKYKSGPAPGKWIDAKVFSTPTHGDNNAPSDVVFSKGIHTITFAPRSTGYHIDSVKIIKKGGTVIPQPEPEPEPEPEPGDGVTSARIAATHDDFESNKAGASNDLEFGRDGAGAQSVGLRFKGLEVEAGAEIESAYFVFTAAKTSAGAARLEIEIEDTTAARTYSKTAGIDGRTYLDESVVWDAGAWTRGETYRSADIAELIEAAIGDGGLDALDALAFRITGSGARAAYAFESGQGTPQLVIEYA
jgi:hypothetical protein